VCIQNFPIKTSFLCHFDDFDLAEKGFKFAHRSKISIASAKMWQKINLENSFD